jgi:hypothetical protein
MRGAGQSAMLMDGTVLRRIQGAISYECWADLDFENELKGGGSDHLAADHKSQT